MNTRAMIICCALATGGCATTVPTPQPPQTVTVTKVVDTACDWVKSITVSKADTDQTKRQILAHDLAVAKNCPQK
ncbi:hypothetical protein [Caballeronia sp. ATUFL_M2_KS44]|uniref:hypothetical protein n=1 Tax=Caballeronia sp. ATUFL_M2_KS44 TaxID=2921767 RepID=UPI0020277EA0|nr:hypothetical protein [Caballeronia sp. ATUFL_M2_KS44]